MRDESFSQKRTEIHTGAKQKRGVITGERRKGQAQASRGGQLGGEDPLGQGARRGPLGRVGVPAVADEVAQGAGALLAEGGAGALHRQDRRPVVEGLAGGGRGAEIHLGDPRRLHTSVWARMELERHCWQPPNGTKNLQQKRHYEHYEKWNYEYMNI